jgi:hypothetical protein
MTAVADTGHWPRGTVSQREWPEAAVAERETGTLKVIDKLNDCSRQAGVVRAFDQGRQRQSSASPRLLSAAKRLRYFSVDAPDKLSLAVSEQ